MDRWSYHPSKSLTCGNSPRWIFPWLLESWIVDPVNHQSRWLVMIRQGEFSLTFGNADRWSYHPPKSLTSDDSQRWISPWLLELCFNYLSHLSKSLTCGDLPKGIYPWLLEMRIGDLITLQSRWLVMTRQGGFTHDNWHHGSMILSSVQVVDLW